MSLIFLTDLPVRCALCPFDVSTEDGLRGKAIVIPATQAAGGDALAHCECVTRSVLVATLLATMALDERGH